MLKNVTLSADDKLIRAARTRARQESTTLNAVFRDWLGRYVGRGQRGAEYRELMERLNQTDSGRAFSRDELNER